MIKIELLLIAALVCLSVCAPGEPVFSDNQEFLEQYFSVKSVENKAISNPTLERVASRDFVSLNYSTPGLHKNRVQIDWDKVINIAEKVWCECVNVCGKKCSSIVTVLNRFGSL